MLTFLIHSLLLAHFALGATYFNYCGELKYLRLYDLSYGEIGFFNEQQPPNLIKVQELRTVQVVKEALQAHFPILTRESEMGLYVEWLSESTPNQSVQICLDSAKMNAEKHGPLTRYYLAQVVRVRLWMSGENISDVSLSVPVRRQMGH